MSNFEQTSQSIHFFSLGLCCDQIEVKNNHVDNIDKNVFTMYYQVKEKVKGHDFYKSDPVYPPSDKLTSNSAG